LNFFLKNRQASKPADSQLILRDKPFLTYSLFIKIKAVKIVFIDSIDHVFVKFDLILLEELAGLAVFPEQALESGIDDDVSVFLLNACDVGRIRHGDLLDELVSALVFIHFVFIVIRRRLIDFFFAHTQVILDLHA
jgi:hypothetical protein